MIQLFDQLVKMLMTEQEIGGQANKKQKQANLLQQLNLISNWISKN